MAGRYDFSEYSGKYDFSEFSGGSARKSQAREMAGWERTLDLLSRTTYVSAGFADRMLDEDTRNIAEAWNFARGEFFTPEERLTYGDVLKRHAPEWSAKHPVVAFTAGIGMDIALDPLTYLGPGLIKGAGNLTGGVLRGGTKAARAMNAIRKGDLYADLGEAGARGMAIGIADMEAASGGAELARAGVKLMETKRAAREIHQARAAATKSVTRQWGKRNKNLQKVHAREVSEHQVATQRAGRAAETEALIDIEQYGVADARRVRDIRRQYPTLPEQAVRQAAQHGRSTKLAAETAPRTAGRTKRVKELRTAKEGREFSKVVPEQTINPKFGKGQGPGRMSQADEIVRIGEPLAETGGPQMALHTREAVPSTNVTRLGKPIKDPLRGRGGTPHSDEVLEYVREVQKPVDEVMTGKMAEINLRHQSELRQLGEWRIRALNDGINVKETAETIGRARANTTRMKAKWLVSEDKRIADVMTSNKLRELFEEGGKKSLAGAAKDEWKQLDKSLGIISGSKRLEAWAANSDTFLGRKYDTFKEMFQRDYKLPDWLIESRNLMYAKMTRAVPRVQDELKEIFGVLSKADSERLGTKFYDVFYETERVKKAQGGLKPGQAAEIRAAAFADVTENERVVVAKVYQRFKEVGELDHTAGLVDELMENYVPGLYQNLETNFLGMSRKLRKNIPNEFTPGEHKVFRSIDEVTHAGMKPVRDLQTLFTARVLAHEQGLAQALFNSELETVYKGLKMVKNPGPDDLLRYKTSISKTAMAKNHPGAKLITEGPQKGAYVAKSGELLTPSDRVLNEVSYIGQGLYGPEGFAGANKILQSYDKALGYFRASATVLKPAFAFKQIVSNTAQVYLEYGAKGVLRMYDPRVMRDTAMIMSRNDGLLKLRGVMDEMIPGTSLKDEIMEMGMMTNTPMDVGLAKNWNPRNVREMQRLVNRERGIRKAADKTSAGLGTKSAEISEGFHRTFLGALKYTDLPGHVEDWARVSTFINGRRMGMNKQQAAKHVQNSLFNYLHGLSEFEAKWMRRVVPFYSYQRFAIPLMAKTLLTAPGRVVNLGKGTKAGFELMGEGKRFAENAMNAYYVDEDGTKTKVSKIADAMFAGLDKFGKGETLTESERRLTPGWLIDQPHAFEDFDERMQATFGTYNSFSPLDILTNFQDPLGTEGGDFDFDEGMSRALEKGFLSQITPILKVPLERLTNHKFFQGTPVIREKGIQDPAAGKTAQGDYEADVFFANLVGATSALLSQKAQGNVAGLSTAWALIGRFMGKEVAQGNEDVIEQFLEVATGWEDGIDPETGERTVYMSPHRIHIMQSFFPFMKEVFRQSDPELTPIEKTLSLFTGRQTVKLDLGKELQRKQQEAISVMQQKSSNATSFMLQGRVAQYERSIMELRSLYDEVGDHMTALQDAGVRRAHPARWRANIQLPDPDENEKNKYDFSEFGGTGGN